MSVVATIRFFLKKHLSLIGAFLLSHHDKIYHVTVMPCFDRKLEASREEYTVDGKRFLFFPFSHFPFTFVFHSLSLPFILFHRISFNRSFYFLFLNIALIDTVLSTFEVVDLIEKKGKPLNEYPLGEVSRYVS